MQPYLPPILRLYDRKHNFYAVAIKTNQFRTIEPLMADKAESTKQKERGNERTNRGHRTTTQVTVCWRDYLSVFLSSLLQKCSKSNVQIHESENSSNKQQQIATHAELPVSSCHQGEGFCEHSQMELGGARLTPQDRHYYGLIM